MGKGKKSKVTLDTTFFEILNKEVEDLKSDVGNYVAGETTRRLSEKAHEAIALFYEDYDPVQYKRHGYFTQFGFKPYRNSNTKTGLYYGGIRLTPELFPENAYKEDTNLVYGMVMGCIIQDSGEVDYESTKALGGYHGPYSLMQNDPPPMRPDPITLILEELDNICDDGDKLLMDGVRHSKQKRNYKLLNF